MNIYSKKLLSITIASLILAACGGDDGDNGAQGPVGLTGPTGETGPAGPTGPAAEIPTPSEITVAGGRLAQDFADATAATTNAFTLIAGAPSEFDADDDDVAPGPPSVGADIPVTYFGPAPSDSNRNLIGPVQLLTSSQVNLDEGTVTLPLYEGRIIGDSAAAGERFFYIVTDTTDSAAAEALGLNFSGKLEYADIVRPAIGGGFESTTVRSGYYDSEGRLLTKGGSVDFSPVRSVNNNVTQADVIAAESSSTPANLLDTLNFVPGAVGANDIDNGDFYSPLVRINNAGDHIYNAPMVSFGADEAALAPYCDGISADEEIAAREILHDSVESICPGDDGEPGTVTMKLALGFSFGRPVLYLSTDATAGIAASLEGAIHAPALGGVPIGRDDSLFSAVERIFGFVNGDTNDELDTTGGAQVHPQRQGFNSAVLGQGDPLNVLGGIPTIATDYSPLWDLNLGEWTPESIDKGYRSRMTEEFQILGMVERGFITGPGGSAYGSSGIIINCPIVQRLL